MKRATIATIFVIAMSFMPEALTLFFAVKSLKTAGLIGFVVGGLTGFIQRSILRDPF